MLARLRRRRDARGMTLVEVLVAMTMLSIVIALATGAVIRALDHNSFLNQETDAQERNNVGLEQLTRALRQAVLPTGGTAKTSSIITIAQPNQVQFTTRLQSTSSAQSSTNCDAVTGKCTWATTPTQVMAQLNTTTHQLMWGTGAQQAGTCVGICTYAAPSLTRALVYGVRNNLLSTACPNNTGDGAVFHYWYVDPTGNLAPWSSATNTLASISVVQIDLYTQTQTGPQKPGCVALTDYVELRNWSK